MDAVHFLQQLVELESLSGREEAAAHFLAEQMHILGYDQAFVDPAGNSVGVRSCPNAQGEITQEIVLLGHMDTVPGRIPVRVENGRLYGRGSVDAKGPLATFVRAGAQANLSAGTRLVVIGATEEESATSRGARYARDQYRPTYCIIGEPSGWEGITLGYKGRVLMDYTLSQEMGHTAGPESGPAEAAVALWNSLNSYCQTFNAQHPKLFDQLLPSLREINTHSDGLTNSVSLKMGFRLPPGFEVQQLAAAAEQVNGSGELTVYAHELAYQSDRHNPLFRAFSAAIRSAGGKPTPKLKTGTSDMNVVGPVWNCPMVAYGPGDSKLDHTPHEHLVIEEYLQAIAVLTQVLEEVKKED